MISDENNLRLVANFADMYCLENAYFFEVLERKVLKVIRAETMSDNCIIEIVGNIA
jgi:hypothetical protein